MENYLMINGKKIELTEEQVGQITGKVEKNIFEPEEEEMYYYISASGMVGWSEWDSESSVDEGYKGNYNCCTDKPYMENLKLEQLLYRQLKQFSVLHGWNDDVWCGVWDGDNQVEVPRKYCINYSKAGWVIENTYSRFNPGKVYFTCHQNAKQAIDEIVKPFYQEHPNFQPWVKR